MITEPLPDLLARWRDAVRSGGLDAVRVEADSILARQASDPEIVTCCSAVQGDEAEAATRLGHLIAAADDARAVLAVADQLASADSIGVVSHGPLTTEVLGAVLQRTEELLPLVTDRPSVARGLVGLGAHPILDDPAGADRFLLPAVAVHQQRVWSSASILSTANRATRADPTAVVVHSRPLAHLDDRARRAFRPEAWVDEASDERWSVPYRPVRA
jgi:hypothetical protein